MRYLGLTRHGPRAVWGQAALLTTLSFLVSHIIHLPMCPPDRMICFAHTSAHFIRALNPRPHMLFPHPRTHMGGGVQLPHAISPLIEIELWDKDQTNPWDVVSPMIPDLTSLGHILTPPGADFIKGRKIRPAHLSTQFGSILRPSAHSHYLSSEVAKMQ